MVAIVPPGSGDLESIAYSSLDQIASDSCNRTAHKPLTDVELYQPMDTTFWLPQAEAALAGCVKSAPLRHSLPTPVDNPPERET